MNSYCGSCKIKTDHLENLEKLEKLDLELIAVYDVCEMQHLRLYALWLDLELTFRLPSYLLRHRLPRGGVVTPFRFRVRFKILYRVIYPLIQHCLLHKMVYLNIIYVIATQNYEFFTTGIFP